MAAALILSVVCIGYFILYSILVDMTNKFTWFWLLLGIGLMTGSGLALWLQYQGIRVPVWLHRGSCAAAGILIVIFLVVEGILIGYGRDKPDPGADYVIVLGARVIGKKPSYNLEKRLEKAYDYLNANPGTKAVLSGGQGPGEDISEAQAMCEYMTGHGIARDRLIMEDQSVNTDQNLEYSIHALESKDKRVILVSSRFHIYRSLGIARKKGLTHVQGLGSRVKWYTAPNMYVREAFAVVKYKLCGQI